MYSPSESIDELLRRDFQERKRVNAKFSLRSYSKVLALSPAHLSQILSGKRQVKAKSALTICERLGLSPSETMSLLQRSKEPDKRSSVRVLSKSEFTLIGRWYYYGILGLANLKTNVARPQWIAKRLGISVADARQAYQQLIEQGYLIEQRGQFRQATVDLRTEDDISTSSIRRYHKQNLELAAMRIDQVPPEMREFSTMTFPICMKRLPAAKTLLRKLREEFCAEVSRGDRTEVFNLCIQFFPVSELNMQQRKKK